jgi:hypothetical protein
MIGQRIVNSLPFRAPGRFFRGNVHTHSNVSDGGLSPGEVISAYRANGYDFVSITDHFRERFGYPVTDTTEFQCDAFTTIPGAELHAPSLENGEDWHILAVGLPPEFPAPAAEEDGPAIAARAREAGAFVAIAHPHWYSMTMDDARSIESAHAVEIYNQTCAMANDRGNGWYLADLMLSEGRRITAIGTDDAHCKDGRPDMFGAWVMVRSETLDSDSLLAALKAGHFYTSQGPLLHDVCIDENRERITIHCSPVNSICVAGRAQRTYDTHGLGISCCEFPLDKFMDSYCRVTLIDENGKRAWSNPIWLD